MLAIIIIILRGKLVHNLENEIKIWTLDSAGEDLRFKLEFRAKIITAFTMINTIIAMIGGILYVKPLSDNVNLFFALRLIHDYFPNYKNVFEFLYRMSLPIFGYLMIVHCYQIMYYTQHINFQIEMFKKLLINLANWENTSSLENDLFYNPEYQMEIKQRLKFCIIRWGEFIQ